MLIRTSPLIVPPEDQARIYEAWRQRSIINKQWSDLLSERTGQQLGPLRRRLIGVVDTSTNLSSMVADQTCTLFDQEPEQQHTDPTSLAALQAAFDAGGWWTMARQNQKYVRTMGESLVRVGWDDELMHPTYELVTPDVVTIECARTNRSRPVTIWHGQRRPVRPDSTEEAWFWDRWSIKDGVGSLSIWTNDRRTDVTARFLDPSQWNGESYPYRDEQGRPLLPYVVYTCGNAGGGIWSPVGYTSDLVEATLQVGVLSSSFIHGVLRASFDLRYIANGRVRGGATETVNGSGVATMVTDPTGLLQVDPSTPNGPVQIGALGASVDILAHETVCRLWTNRLAVNFGLSPSDVVIESLNPASGSSITVSQEGKRRLAKKDLPHFRRGDLQLAQLTAAVLRSYGQPCTASGYRLRYAGMALTMEERLKATQYLEAEVRLGVADAVAIYQELHPGTSREEAIADLEQMRMEVARRNILAELQQPPGGTPAAN